VHNIVATVLLSDLEKMLAHTEVINRDLDYSASNNEKWFLVMEKWRRFLVSLLHHRLTKIHLPNRFYWSELNIVEFVKLLDEIGAKCPGLQLIEAKANNLDDPPDVKEKDFRLRNSFFRALPQLLHLQVVRLQFFICDDWALQQFGEHGQNIV
jgi:hypothetical protein